MATYTITYELDKTGWWVASVAGIQGCHTQGRSIRQARNRIRQALGLFVKDADSAALVDRIKFPKQLKALVLKVISARNKADEQQTLAQELTQNTALTLVKTFGLSRRDVAEILGLSHQRVQQLLDRS